MLYTSPCVYSLRRSWSGRTVHHYYTCNEPGSLLDARRNNIMCLLWHGHSFNAAVVAVIAVWVCVCTKLRTNPSSRPSLIHGVVGFSWLNLTTAKTNLKTNQTGEIQGNKAAIMYNYSLYLQSRIATQTKTTSQSAGGENLHRISYIMFPMCS